MRSLQVYNSTLLMLLNKSCEWKSCPNSLLSTTFLGCPDHNCRCTPGSRNLVLGRHCRPRTSLCGWSLHSIGTAAGTREMEEKHFLGIFDKTVSLPRVWLARQRIEMKGTEESLHWAETELQCFLCSHFIVSLRKKNSFQTQMQVFFVHIFAPLGVK